MNLLRKMIFLSFLTISLVNSCSCEKKQPTCEQKVDKNYCDLPTETRDLRMNKATCEMGSYLLCKQMKEDYNEVIKYLNNHNITP